MKPKALISWLSGAQRDGRILARMFRAWRRGEHRRGAWRVLGIVAGAAGYLVIPIDIIPDFILGLGLLDDATVLGLALGLIRREIAAFVRWEEDVRRRREELRSDSESAGPTPRVPPS